MISLNKALPDFNKWRNVWNKLNTYLSNF
jgi:hypothetical protein